MGMALVIEQEQGNRVLTAKEEAERKALANCFLADCEKAKKSGLSEKTNEQIWAKYGL